MTNAALYGELAVWPACRAHAEPLSDVLFLQGAMVTGRYGVRRARLLGPLVAAFCFISGWDERLAADRVHY